MAKNNGGWIKLHRVLFEHPIWLHSTPQQKVILIALLGMANHEPNKWEWNGEVFNVKRGQMITSIDGIKKHCGKGISTQNIRTALVRFEKLGFLTNESTKTGRLITIEKYAKWQDLDEPTNKGTNKDLTKTSQRPNKDLTPNKNDKKDKNDKNIYIEVPDYLFSSFKAWAKMRESIGKPITTKATVTRALNKLYKLSDSQDEQIRIVEQAVDRCWLSFYPLRNEPSEPVKRYKEFETADYERDDFQAAEMPDEIREKLSDLFRG